MTVKELIAALEKLPADAKVYLPDRDYGRYECSSAEIHNPEGVYLGGHHEDEDE